MHRQNAVFVSCSIALLALTIFIAGLLPYSIISGLLVSLSYSGSTDGTALAIAEFLFRLVLTTVAIVIGLHAIPEIRNLWMSRILPCPPSEARLDDNWPGNQDLKLWIGLSGFLVLLGMPLFVALTFRSDWLRPLLQEDSGFEAATAFMYFAGAALLGIAAFRAFRNVRPFGFVHVPFIGLTLLLLWVGLEEISYGQRTLKFDVPEYWKSVNQQQEFNLHNLATGLVNRLFSVAVYVCGIFLPMAAWFSPRIKYLAHRLRILLPQNASVLVFAFASVFTTPRRFVLSSFDEVRFMNYIIILTFAAVLLYSFRHPQRRKDVTPLLCSLALLVGARLTLDAWENRFPVPNYPEEFKEFLFSFGFALYSWSLLKWSGLTHPDTPREH